MTTEKKNLHQKLVEVRKNVVYIQHDKKGHNYSYASEGAVLDKIRPAMDEQKVILEMDMTKLVIEGEFIRAEFTFSFINADVPEERLEKHIILLEPTKNLDVKKCGALMTYASKYFMFKFFNIEMGNDPDGDQTKETPKPAPAFERMTKLEIETLDQLGEQNPTDRDKIFAFHNIKSFSDPKIPREKFHYLMNKLCPFPGSEVNK